MISKHLKTLRANILGIQPIHSRIIEDLERTNILAFLLERARPRVADGGAFIHKTAYEAARSEGYFQALTDLIDLVDLHLTNSDEKPATPIATYGAGATLKRNGTLTEAEIKAIKDGKLPDQRTPKNIAPPRPSTDA